MIESKVNMTSGGAVLVVAAGGLPNNMTVSPDNTLLTRAIPIGGNCNALGVLVVMLLEEATTGADVDFVVVAVVVVVDGVGVIFIDAIIAAVLVGAVVMLLNDFGFVLFCLLIGMKVENVHIFYFICCMISYIVGDMGCEKGKRLLRCFFCGFHFLTMSHNLLEKIFVQQ